MYERFTDRARKAIQLANQEAQRWNHECVETEHVLLGICKEGSGIAINVMKNLGADPRVVSLEVEKEMKPGPDMVTMGKLPQTPRVKRVLEGAVTEARELGFNHVGTEHLLLGLLREGESLPCRVLNRLGATLEKARAEILTLCGKDEKKLEPLGVIHADDHPSTDGFLIALRKKFQEHGVVQVFQVGIPTFFAVSNGTAGLKIGEWVTLFAREKTLP